MSSSRIVEFYNGSALDHRGRTLQQLQAQSLSALESNHDYIQWLFPLPERSSANASAPILSAGDIRAFQDSEALRSRLLRSFAVMLKFYGLELSTSADGLEVRSGASFAERSDVWLTPYNHNYLRLTRILRSLSLLGCAAHAQALFACLERIYREYGDRVSADTFEYWKAGVAV